jgi:hypothetical protein
MVAACGNSTSTATPAPTTGASLTAPASVPASVVPDPVATPTAAPTATPTATAKATAVPTATPTPAPTAASDRAAACTGTKQFKSLFADGARQLPFATYCAVLADDWWIHEGEYTLRNGGILGVQYQNGRDFMLLLEEGNLCSGMLGDCNFGIDSVGRIWLGDMAADLYVLAVPGIPAGPGPYLAYTSLGRGHDYWLIGMGMSKETFVKIAKAVVRVPKA